MELKLSIVGSHPQVALIGGEVAGKSSILPYLFENLPKYGIKPFIVPEAATTLFSNGVQVSEVTNVQELIVKKILSDEAMFQSAANHYTGDFRPLIICDRGVLDCKAYSKPGEFEEILSSIGLTEHHIKERYAAVIHLVTTARGAEDVFRRAFKDNPVRIESSIEQAQARDEKVQNSWLGCQKLHVVPNKETFEEKKRETLNIFLHLMGIPIPQEIEYKFLIHKGFSRSQIPVASETVSLTQYYLHETPRLKTMNYPKDAERVIERVRIRESHGSRSFIYTVKAKVPGESAPYEVENFLSEQEFIGLVQYANGRPIKKDRTYFVWKDQYFEFDEFPHAIDDHGNDKLLELEIAEKAKAVVWPDFLGEQVDVSESPEYKNEYIAKRLVA